MDKHLKETGGPKIHVLRPNAAECFALFIYAKQEVIAAFSVAVKTGINRQPLRIEFTKIGLEKSEEAKTRPLLTMDDTTLSHRVSQGQFLSQTQLAISDLFEAVKERVSTNGEIAIIGQMDQCEDIVTHANSIDELEGFWKMDDNELDILKSFNDLGLFESRSMQKLAKALDGDIYVGVMPDPHRHAGML